MTTDKRNLVTTLPPIAAALLLDEYRRHLGEEGRAFMRAPREQYDGQGNLWSVTYRDSSDKREARLALTCHENHTGWVRARNEAYQAESDLAHVLTTTRGLLSSYKAAVAASDNVLAVTLRERLDELETERQRLRKCIDGFRAQYTQPSIIEYRFPPNLSSWNVVIEEANAAPDPSLQ